MKYLILGPGAVGFFAQLGYLKKIEDKLADVEEIAGSSSGAMLGFLILSGKSIQQIFELTINIDTAEFTRVDLKNFISSFGFLSHEIIKQKLIELWGGNPTFKELSKKLYVSAYCLNTLEVEYFSRDTHPDMNVVDAICASISIPVMFSPYKLGDKMYLDGGTNERKPIGPFLNKNFDDLFSITITHQPKPPGDIKNMFDFLKSLALTAYKLRHHTVTPGVRINAQSFNIMNLKAPFEDRLKLYMIGMES